MKKEYINNDIIRVIHQPKHTICSVIVMNTGYPLSPEVHEGIFKLGEVSDLMFIFSRKLFPVETSGISPEKLTTLYGGCAWTEYTYDSGPSIGMTIFRALLYCQEIFDKHIGYTISQASDLVRINEVCKNLVKINMSSVAKPIYKIRRLGSEELFKFYKQSGKKEKMGCGGLSVFSGIDLENIKASILGKLLYEKEPDCRYCTWHSESKVMYFRNGTIKTMLAMFLNVDEKDKFINILGTFTDPDPRYIFSCLPKLLGISNLNYNIEDLEIEKL